MSGIRVSETHPRYWALDGDPTVLLGGSSKDNLFQIDDLDRELDVLANAGGNYVRNTMSARASFAVQPFEAVEPDQYDLEQWNDEYWDRFEHFLEATSGREIVPQIELWALHDFFEYGPWTENPWNPARNVTYDAHETTLQLEPYEDYWTSRHDFFLTVPSLQHDEVVLDHQRRFVDRILETALDYDHVLYCVTNEIFSQFDPEWGWYWADYVHDAAAEIGTEVAVTEMYQREELTDEQHRASLDHPGHFDYVEASQNSGMVRDTHWENLQYVYGELSENSRPINHVKTYGGQEHWTDGPNQGIERFWRSLLGGGASVRFHRPIAGIGLSTRAKRHIASAGTFLDAFDLIEATPDTEHELLSNRAPNEAYCAAVPGAQYAVYLPDGGSVELEVPESEDGWELEYLWLENDAWFSPAEKPLSGSPISVDPGSLGHWLALITRA